MTAPVPGPISSTAMSAIPGPTGTEAAIARPSRREDGDTAPITSGRRSQPRKKRTSSDDRLRGSAARELETLMASCLQKD
ncbi:hypothetical protein Sa4125_45040 [Aureimonas sp. SA4125]|nr:hypothetical protein Sa4125_45040 [Aureimonas sp. SA4125]